MSHICECTLPCNCAIDEDGFWTNRPQDGRRNTVVSGSGTENDPLTISFMQSEFFRPNAGEKRVSSLILPSSDNQGVNTFDFNVDVYQTPTEFFVSTAIIPTVFLFKSNYYVVGASATFAPNASGVRQIAIITADAINDLPRVIAGNIQAGIATRSSVLTCSGFVSGYLTNSLPAAGVLDIRTTPVVVAVYQTSGGDLNVTNIKLWVTMV